MFTEDEIKNIDTDIYSEMSVSKLPIIGNLKIKMQYLILLILFVVSLGLSFYFLIHSFKIDYKSSNIESEYFNVKKINSNYNGHEINDKLLKSASESSDLKYKSIISSYNDINKISIKIISNKENFLKMDSLVNNLKQSKSSSNNINTFLNLYNSNNLNNSDFDLLNIESPIISSIKLNKNSIINKNKLLKDHLYLINELEHKIYDYLELNSHKNNSIIYLFVSITSLILSFLFLSCMFLVYLFEKDRKQVIDAKKNMEIESTTLKLISELIPFKLNDYTKFVTVSDGLVGSVSSEINEILHNLRNILKSVKLNSTDVLINSDYILNWFIDNKNKTYELESKINNSSRTFSKFSNKFSNNINLLEKIKDNSNNNNSDDINHNFASTIKTDIENKNKKIESNLNHINILIKSLEFKLNEINSSIDIISDISEEISVLSANASINANNNKENNVKVIINNIKSLSENSNISISKIVDTINDFNTLNNEINTTSETINNDLNELKLISKNYIKNMLEVISKSNYKSDVISELETNLLEQGIIIDSLEQEISDTFVKSKLIINGIQEKEIVIENLKENSNSLDNIVSMVKLGN